MRTTKLLLLLCLLLSVVTSEASAQQLTPTPTPGAASQAEENSVAETMPIKHKRRRAARPAEYQGAGVLQLEYGYSGDFKAPGTPDSQALTLSLNYALTDKLQLEFANDNFDTQSAPGGRRANGVGNTYIGFQYTLQGEAKKRPALAFAYQLTLPTGSQSKGFSDGRDFHSLTGIISKEIKDTDINFNVGLLLNGRQGSRNYDKGAAVALGFGRNHKKGFGLQCEVFGQTLDAGEPRGVFASTTLTFQPGLRRQYDFGVRVSLTPTAPRLGFSAGWTFSFPKFKKWI